MVGFRFANAGVQMGKSPRHQAYSSLFRCKKRTCAGRSRARNKIKYAFIAMR